MWVWGLGGLRGHYAGICRSAAVTVLLAFLISACSTDTASKLIKLAHGQVNGETGVTLYAPTNTVFSFESDMHVCSTKPVPIDNLTLLHASPGVRLDRWGVDNRGSVLTPHWIQGRLSKLGPYQSRRVTLRCGSANDTYALGAHIGVELVRTDNRVAHLDGFVLHYRGSGQPKTLTLLNDMRLCKKPARPCGRLTDGH